MQVEHKMKQVRENFVWISDYQLSDIQPQIKLQSREARKVLKVQSHKILHSCLEIHERFQFEKVDKTIAN